MNSKGMLCYVWLEEKYEKASKGQKLCGKGAGITVVSSASG